MKSTNNFESAFLGKIEFESAFQIQRNLWQAAKEKKQSSIMGLEHPAVMTLGRRVKDVFNPLNLPVVQTTRGGLVTVHSEGQLVIYPIMNLRDQKIGVKAFVEHLLQITQKTFEDFEVKTCIDDQRIGLYTEKGKIAFCGLEIKEGISQHGVSINIANDLSLFKGIVSCGINEMPVDRLQNYRFDVDLETFFRAWLENFKGSGYFQLLIPFC